MYIAGRAILGTGISIALAAAPTLLQEIAHPRYRAPLGGMCKFPMSQFHAFDDQEKIED